MVTGPAGPALWEPSSPSKQQQLGGTILSWPTIGLGTQKSALGYGLTACGEEPPAWKLQLLSGPGGMGKTVQLQRRGRQGGS